MDLRSCDEEELKKISLQNNESNENQDLLVKRHSVANSFLSGFTESG